MSWQASQIIETGSLVANHTADHSHRFKINPICWHKDNVYMLHMGNFVAPYTWDEVTMFEKAKWPNLAWILDDIGPLISIYDLKYVY